MFRGNTTIKLNNANSSHGYVPLLPKTEVKKQPTHRSAFGTTQLSSTNPLSNQFIKPSDRPIRLRHVKPDYDTKLHERESIISVFSKKVLTLALEKNPSVDPKAIQAEARTVAKKLLRFVYVLSCSSIGIVYDISYKSMTSGDDYRKFYQANHSYDLTNICRPESINAPSIDIGEVISWYFFQKCIVSKEDAPTCFSIGMNRNDLSKPLTEITYDAIEKHPHGSREHAFLLNMHLNIQPDIHSQSPVTLGDSTVSRQTTIADENMYY